MRKALIILAAALLGGMSAAEYPVEKLTLCGGAVAENGVLKLDGRKAYAVIPGTESVAVVAPGATFACSVKPQFEARKGARNEIMDAYFSKQGVPFTLCRWGGAISSRIRNAATGKYEIVRCYALPKAGAWTHLAFVIEPAAGKENVWNFRFYVNGQLKFEKTVENLSPDVGRGPVELGKGWAGPWMFSGEMTDITVEPKVLTAEEIAGLAAKSRARK
ncbi:MAG: LamG domain-containing protein [Lentisphaeria bacterium]|nr:LamG domain-containing protein [Lentisphaeria bacterium]